jgi:hypothetical protein
MDVAALATTAGSIGAVLTLLFIAVQLRDSRRSTQAQLVNTLEQEFRSLYPVYSSLLEGGKWSNTGKGPLSDQDLCDLEAYVQFFERMQLLRDLRALELRNLDRLYGQRFFLIMHNRHVQDKLLYRDEEYYVALIELYRDWFDYRTRRGLPLPNPGHLPSSGFTPRGIRTTAHPVPRP